MCVLIVKYSDNERTSDIGLLQAALYLHFYSQLIVKP